MTMKNCSLSKSFAGRKFEPRLRIDFQKILEDNWKMSLLQPINLALASERDEIDWYFPKFYYLKKKFFWLLGREYFSYFLAFKA